MFDRYHDVLNRPAKPVLPKQPAELGLVVEDVETGWCGAIVRVEKSGGALIVELADRFDKVRAFEVGPGFLLDGQPIELVAPNRAKTNAKHAAQSKPTRTASGSVKVHNEPAKVAAASRIWVEGRHDAELIEKIWGDDLRSVAIVVEPLGGIDDLAAAIADFNPGPTRRLGILVDHLVSGTKESKIVEALNIDTESVLILGHPYVDVWQAIKPTVLGMDAWPQIPRHLPWKTGILAHLGLPHQTQTDTANGWRQILSKVSTYQDIEPALLAKVEELIDFVSQQ